MLTTSRATGLALLLAACSRPSPPGSRPATSGLAEAPFLADSAPTTPAAPLASSPSTAASASPLPGASASAPLGRCARVRPPPPRALCLALLGEPLAPGERCDASFHPHMARFVDCSPGDLLCNLRRGSWGLAPVYQEPPAAEVASCIAECDAGNGASCARVARAFAPRTSQTSAAERAACEALFQGDACRAGLPSACPETSCGEDEPTPRQAFDHLDRLCRPGEASWACFYLAHSMDMLWGSGKVEKRAGFKEICAARCPAPPERCYRTMACEVLRPRR